MNNDEARSTFKLMMITAWADGVLDAAETLTADAVQAELPELLALPDRGALADAARALLEARGLRAALAETANGLREPAARELAFVACARILEADGTISQQEFQVLSELKRLFELSAPDVARLLRAP